MAAAEPPPPMPHEGAAAPQPQPKRRGCMRYCPAVQQHAMAEAGGSRCVAPKIMAAWRIAVGVLLLVPIVLSLALRVALGDWILYAVNCITFVALGVCSLRHADHEESASLSSTTAFAHTFAATAASYYAPWYIYEAARLATPRIALGTLPYAAFLADALVMQAQLRPPFVYGLPSLLFWYANLLIEVLFFRANLLFALLFAGLAVPMLFVTIGLTRIFGLQSTPLPDHNNMPIEVGDEMWA